MAHLFKTMSGAAMLTALLAFPALAVDPGMPGKTNKGDALVDSKGMTLYTFTKDETGKSACVAQCATNWPPLKASEQAKPMGSWTVVAREDGSKQWAYKGKPLYTWAKDTKAGEAGGDGMGGMWHIAKP